MNWFTKLFRRKAVPVDDAVEKYCARRGCVAGETHCDGFCRGVAPDGSPVRPECRRDALRDLQVPPFPTAPSPASNRVVSLRGSSFSKTREVRSSAALAAPYQPSAAPAPDDSYLWVAAAALSARDPEPSAPAPSYSSGGGGDYSGGGASGSWDSGSSSSDSGSSSSFSSSD